MPSVAPHGVTISPLARAAADGGLTSRDFPPVCGRPGSAEVTATDQHEGGPRFPRAYRAALGPRCARLRPPGGAGRRRSRSRRPRGASTVARRAPNARTRSLFRHGTSTSLARGLRTNTAGTGNLRDTAMAPTLANAAEGRHPRQIGKHVPICTSMRNPPPARRSPVEKRPVDPKRIPRDCVAPIEPPRRAWGPSSPSSRSALEIRARRVAANRSSLARTARRTPLAWRRPSTFRGRRPCRSAYLHSRTSA